LFTIKHIQNKDSNLNYIELKDSSGSSRAIISLNLGGSLQELTLKNNSIIKDLHPLNYDKSFASAILFPFAGRIRNGSYTYKEKKYRLAINNSDENSVLHGLVYNKIFSVVEKKSSSTQAEVKLAYTEKNKTQGFPYKYNIQLHYTLTIDTIDLTVTIKNNDIISFPFCVGWHPYFHSEDLYNSYIRLKSDEKLSFDDKMIPVEIKKIITEKDLKIKDRKFDDCYILNSNYICFKTPSYSVKLSSSSEENYLQVYTPSKRNTVAIEPITGPSNNFNNKIGLKILDSEDTYNVNWTIKLKENE